MNLFYHLFLLVLIIGQALAFTQKGLVRQAQKKATSSSLFVCSRSDSGFERPGRREIIKAASVMFTPALLASGSFPAFADVSDGNALPQGAVRVLP